MIARQRPLGFMVALALAFALVLGPGFTRTAAAASEDVAMFYDDLSQYGQWVEVEKYGAVWQPTQVPEDWRPYTNGRWVPTTDGNVFEIRGTVGLGHLPLRQLDAHRKQRLGLGAGAHLVSRHGGVAHQSRKRTGGHLVCRLGPHPAAEL